MEENFPLFCFWGKNMEGKNVFIVEINAIKATSFYEVGLRI